MKTELFKITPPRNGRSRKHSILFDEDTPFKPKVVRRKDQYQRRPKHRNDQSLDV